MIKVENLSMLFSTEEVQTKALNEVTFPKLKRRICRYHGAVRLWKIYLVEYTWNIRYPYFGLLSL